MNWVPILSAEDEVGAQAWATINQITQAMVDRRHETAENVRPVAQRYEDALLYSYLALVHDDVEWANRASASLNEAIDKATNLPHYLGLFGGLAGLGWTIEHVSRFFGDDVEPNGVDEAVRPQVCEDEDVNAEIDMAILRGLHQITSSRQYDLISGLVGFGIYFLERMPRPIAREGLIAVLDQLEDISKQTDIGITWLTRPELLPAWQRELCTDGYYNLGVAHGIPGVIHLLSEVAAECASLSERSLRLLEGAMRWLMAQQRLPGSVSRFSSWVVPGIKDTDSRLAWCYGDLGILAVLLQVSRRWNRSEWRQFALDLLDHCLAWPLDKARVVDAPLCHGAAGVAHIFNRIYQAEGDPRCLEAAVAWFGRTLAFRQPGSGVGGYWQYTRPDPLLPTEWRASAAFLDGSAGIALAFLGALTPVEPRWDRVLLLSSR